MKTYPVPSHRLHEIVRAPKCVQDGQATAFRHYGSKGRKFDSRLDLTNGSFMDLRFFVHSPAPEVVTTFESGLCIAGPRVRGIGYSAVRRLRKYKERIPQGWHENIIDPNLSPGDDNHNRHEALPDFSPTDLQDFTQKSATRWNIRLDFGEGLL